MQTNLDRLETERLRAAKEGERDIGPKVCQCGTVFWGYSDEKYCLTCREEERS